jgi:hypothetical protein
LPCGTRAPHDAHSGARRLRIFLPQQFLTDVDGLHGDFLATDENGQRLFAITSSDGTPQHAALTIVQLAAVPLGIGTITPATVAASGGATLTIRGSGFQSATTLTINGKSVGVSFKDANTLLVVTTSLTAGPQHLTITNPDGESVSLDAAFTANSNPALAFRSFECRVPPGVYPGPSRGGGPLFLFFAFLLTFSR